MSGRIHRGGRNQVVRAVPATRAEREHECAQGGVGALIRISGHYQEGKSKGSVAFQRAQLKHVRRWGVDPASVRLFEFLGHSAGRKQPRPFLEDLLEEICAGRITMVVLGWTSRVGRGLDAKLDAVFEALRERRGAIVAQGRFYDLLDYEDNHRLREQILSAERENEERARLAAVGRYEQAKSMEFALPLPTGLIWANPADPSFRNAMSTTGLGHMLRREYLERHQTRVRRDGSALFVFPDPREDCWRAITFLIEAARATRSISGTLEAVLTASPEVYPRPGYLPVVKHSIYKPSRAISWSRVQGRDDGRDDIPYGRIRWLLFSPALYGIYAYLPSALMPLTHIFPEPIEDVWFPGAFPGLAPPEFYQSTILAINDPARRNIRKGPVPRPLLNLVGRLECSHPLKSGEPCRLSITPSQPSCARRHRYTSASCMHRGHATYIPGTADDTIFDILVEAFNEAQANAEIAIAIEGGYDADSDVQKAEARLRDATSLKDYARQQAKREHDAGNKDAERDWHDEHRRAIATAAQCAREMTVLKSRQERVQRIGEVERKAIVALANDFPTLLAAARKEHNLGRMLVDPLVKKVRARRLGTGVHWINVELSGGQSLGRLHFASNRVPSNACMRALAYGLLVDHLDPDARSTFENDQNAESAAAEIATRWNALIGPRKGGARWNSGDVLAVAYQFNHSRDLRTGRGKTVTDLADELGCPEDELERVALNGVLGTPTHCRNGILRLAPTKNQLTRAIRAVSVRSDSACGDEPLVRVGDHAVRHDVDPVQLGAAAAERRALVTDTTGMQWIPVSLAEEITAGLETPPCSGRWYTFATAREDFPGVIRRQLERLAISGWPRRGRLNRGDARSFWIDDSLKTLLREQTVAEWIAAARMEHRTTEVRSRSKWVKRVNDRTNVVLTQMMLEYAARKGRIIAFSAAPEPYAPRRRWLIIPDEIWHTTDAAVVKAWLRGNHESDAARR